MDTRHRTIDKGYIEHKKTERETRVTLDTRHRKLDTVIIGFKTLKARHG